MRKFLRKILINLLIRLTGENFSIIESKNANFFIVCQEIERFYMMPLETIISQTRKTYLYPTRENQIFQHVVDEELLRASDGATGNLYNWADNRFNRRNGCDARLAQIEKQIEANNSALEISKRIIN